jgi:ABC-type multidrug transport system fused ATPase/permease subunit
LALPIVLATSVLGRRVKVQSADVQQAHAEAGASATEVLAGIRTVRAFSQEAAEYSRYVGQLARALEFVRRKVQARALLGGVSLIAGECAALLAIWMGGRFIVSGRMTTGGLISFILYALLVTATPQRLPVRRESSRAMGALGDHRAARTDADHPARRRTQAHDPTPDSAQVFPLTRPDEAGGRLRIEPRDRRSSAIDRQADAAQPSAVL